MSVMSPEYTVYATQYFTATIYEWQAVLADDNHKDIIISSLQYLTNDKRIELNAFVIMSNHIHLIMAGVNRFYAFRCTGVFYEIYCAANKAFTYKI